MWYADLRTSRESSCTYSAHTHARHGSTRSRPVTFHPCKTNAEAGSASNLVRNCVIITYTCATPMCEQVVHRNAPIGPTILISQVRCSIKPHTSKNQHRCHCSHTCCLHGSTSSRAINPTCRESNASASTVSNLARNFVAHSKMDRNTLARNLHLRVSWCV